MKFKSNFIKLSTATALTLTGLAAVNAAKPAHQVHAATQDKVAVNDRVTVKYQAGSVTIWNSYHANRVATGSYATHNSTYTVREVADDEAGNTFYRVGKDMWIEARFTVKNNTISANSVAAHVATTSNNVVASQAPVASNTTVAAPASSASNNVVAKAVTTNTVASQAPVASNTTVAAPASSASNNVVAKAVTTNTVASQAPVASNTTVAAPASSVSNNVVAKAATTNTVASQAPVASHTTSTQTSQPVKTAVKATTSTPAATQTSSSTASQAADTARAQVGTPYVWGGNTPGGFDCSGLVQYSYGLGSNYRTTYQQTNLGAHQYDIQNAQKGDLYFWGTETAPYHVAVAQGNGNYVQAPAPGQNVKQGNIQYYTPNYYISMQNR